MSQTAPLRYENSFVWVATDAFAAYFSYFREALGVSASANDPWVSEVREKLIGSVAAPPELGVFLHGLSDEQRIVLNDAAAEARRRAITTGDLDRDTLASWRVDEHEFPIHLRYGDVLTVERLIEVADAFEAMLEDRLPPPPPYERWFVGAGTPGTTIGSRVP